MNAKNCKLLFVLVLIGLFLNSANAMASSNGTAREGIYSISRFPDGELLQVDGDWEFYWHELYTPGDFRRDTVRQSPLIVEVPNTWSNYILDGEALPMTGYATYRLYLNLPKEETGTTKALYVPNISSAYTLWIDGIEASKNGVVGKSRDSMEPVNTPKVVPFEVQSNRVELIIQTSNYSQRKAGIFDSILIGEPEMVLQFRDKKIIYRTVIVMSLVTMGLYHLVLFLFRKKEHSLFFFGNVCLFIAIRATLLEEGLASYILPFLSWELAVKLEYLGASLGVLFVSLFTYTQFAKDMNQKLRNAIIAAMSVYSLFVILTPAVVFTRTMIHFQVLIILIFLYLISVYVTAILRKRESSLLNTIAILMLFGTVINDILYFNNVIKTTELTSVGLLFFLFTQSIILSKQYSMSFLRTEKLSQDLAILNASLEQQVHDRTMELQHANIELQAANQKLNEAHQSRSKWIHNISHEISSPLTNIRAYTKGMLDGVIQSDKNYIQLVYEQSLYLSRMLHDLHDMTDMENKQIKFDMKNVDIQEYCNKLYQKYKWDLEKQGINFEYKSSLSDQEENRFVLIDEVRIEQVIVNLLNNAQRFVHENGKIVLELTNEPDEKMMIKVKDNGLGIEEEELGLVFNRFYKNGNQGKSHSGSGLGLAIAKEIVEYHNGTIGVKSIKGEGSCFYFLLPIRFNGIEGQECRPN
ncbi:sensor histidine kinase [Cytobacillus massiliigabonensis]|uniref:sensor histidine kinase n=1 Tax=Cytobacillus massiliigabonensis TaxID=1871011 RepID=UPI0015E1532F|nr:sensor histidine kinase [Cytobacillus massiliigabonensis]